MNKDKNNKEIEKIESDDTTGITLLIDLLNNNDFNIILDLNNPNEDSCKAFALFLNLLERGKIYDVVLEKIKDIQKDDKNLIETLELIFNFKKSIDTGLDLPAILPRDVFKRHIHNGV